MDNFLINGSYPRWRRPAVAVNFFADLFVRRFSARYENCGLVRQPRVNPEGTVYDTVHTVYLLFLIPRSTKKQLTSPALYRSKFSRPIAKKNVLLSTSYRYLHCCQVKTSKSLGDSGQPVVLVVRELTLSCLTCRIGLVIRGETLD